MLRLNNRSFDDPYGNGTDWAIPNCNDFRIAYEVPQIICTITALGIGIFFTFFGYRCLRATLFLSGFVFGSILTFSLCEGEKILPTLGNGGVATGAGVILGLLAMVIPFVGLFISGLLAGLSVGVALVSLLVLAYKPSTQWLSVGLLFATGLICALATLKWRRVTVVLGTSVVGSALIAVSFDYFLELFHTAEFLWRRIADSTPLLLPHCWYSWLVVSLWPLLFIVGSVVQTCVTGRGVVHTIGLRFSGLSEPTSPTVGRLGLSKHTLPGSCEDLHTSQLSINSVLGHRQYRRNPTSGDKKSYRHLYQARRLHGDSLSPSYLESIQRLSTLPGSRATLSSDLTGFTIISANTLPISERSESRRDTVKPPVQ